MKNKGWIVYVIALIAIVALILGAIAVNKANMSGNAFLDLFRKKPKVVETTDYGLLGTVFVNNGGED